MQIPKEIQFIISKLRENEHEAYIVGGCVRDILRNIEPQDWDIATNAKPEEIIKLFAKSFYENKFGTVTVLTGSENPKLKEVEITPYRIDEKYTDKRHPDKIRWAKNLKQDLARRDFTVNAIAMEIQPPYGRPNLLIIDPFKGQRDLKNKIIRAVGKADDRFSEDALRMLRAVRFAVTLSPDVIWQIEEKTARAVQKNANFLKFISQERIRDELIKIINSSLAARGIEMLRRLGLLKYILPELEQGFGVWQNKHHIYQVYQHALLSLNYACQQNFSKYVRWAALLHDIAKPKTKRGEGPEATFYGHEVVGAKMTKIILQRLRFPKKEIEKIVKLVACHLFYYNVNEVGESSVRKLLRKVGKENIDQLLQVRYADRVGSGVPKAEPYKLRHLKYLIEKLSQDPISVKMLKVNGNDVMKLLNIKSSPKVGQVLDVLLGQVLADPKKNKKNILEKEIKKLGKLAEKELISLANKARKEREQIEIKRDQMTKQKYWVT